MDNTLFGLTKKEVGVEARTYSMDAISTVAIVSAIIVFIALLILPEVLSDG